uniref:Transposase n=2 Tax=Candidatus Kentrum sp. LPFa TaxID=2126335 RepID=A0A450WRU5_9GAMM|nr:MAG: Transposase [Candidatus Kentron sp. LPFa]
MIQYPEERKNAVIRKMLAPQNTPILELSRLEGISKWTLYTWRKQAIGENHPASKSSRASGGLSAEAKFAIVVETATLSEEELGRYCRERGLFGEKIKSWKQSFIQGIASNSEQSKLKKTDLQKVRIPTHRDRPFRFVRDRFSNFSRIGGHDSGIRGHVPRNLF